MTCCLVSNIFSFNNNQKISSFCATIVAGFDGGMRINLDHTVFGTSLISDSGNVYRTGVKLCHESGGNVFLVIY